MLKIIHCPSFQEYEYMLLSNGRKIIQECHLLSYKVGENVVITKSRWFVGEYPNKKIDGTFLVDIETYVKIAYDTIDRYFKSANNIIETNMDGEN